MEKQCYFVFKIDRVCRRLMASRFKLVQAVGGMGVNFVMSYSYMIVLAAGAAYARKKEEK